MAEFEFVALLGIIYLVGADFIYARITATAVTAAMEFHTIAGHYFFTIC